MKTTLSFIFLFFIIEFFCLYYIFKEKFLSSKSRWAPKNVCLIANADTDTDPDSAKPNQDGGHQMQPVQWPTSDCLKSTLEAGPSLFTAHQNKSHI
jgi:hypothetical protein